MSERRSNPQSLEEVKGIILSRNLQEPSRMLREELKKNNINKAKNHALRLYEGAGEGITGATELLTALRISFENDQAREATATLVAREYMLKGRGKKGISAVFRALDIGKPK